MKKGLLTFVLGSMIAIGTFVSADAESIWLKEVVGRYDYTKYATWLATQLEIDFGVYPLAAGHSAGSVYTDDGWVTANWNDASWKYNVQGPYGGWDESWKVYIGGSGDNGQQIGQDFIPFNIEYALYVTDANGNWYWDNNGGNNHHYFID